MTGKLRDMTIKTKMTVVIMAVSGAAVLFCCLLFIILSFILLQRDHVQKDLVLENLIAENVQASLMFDIPEDAAEILSSYSADTSIVFACIYDRAGEPFAIYQQEGGKTFEPPEVREPGYFYSDGYLKMFSEIRFEGEKIGTIFLIDDQREVYASFRMEMYTLVFVVLIALGGSYLVANKLQAIVSKPVLSLAATAGEISRTEDYSIRAEKQNEDEIGMLIESFNSMLNEIQSREEEIAESEMKFRSIVESTSDWIWEVDVKGRYVYSSPKIKDVLGYEPEEVIGKTPFDFIIPEEAEETRDDFCKKAQNKEPLKSIENTNLHKDGFEVVLETSGVPIFDENGEYCGYRGIDRDITDKKRSEEALKISEANYRAIFDSVNDGVFIHEYETGKILTINKQASMMLGYTREELKDLSVNDISVVEEGFTQERAKEILLKAESETQFVEWHFKNKYDRDFWGEVSLRPVILEGKRRFLALVRDIDERKRAQDALAASEAKFRAIAENANSGLISMNMRGQIVFWNPAAERMFGYTSREAAGQLFSLVLSEEHYEEYSNDLERVRLNGESKFTGRVVEVSGRRKDGSEFPMEMSLSKWRTSEGLFFTVILIDITERKEAAEALRLDEARLQVLVELNQMTDVTEKELVDFSLEQAINLTKSKIGYIAFMNERETVLNMYSWSSEAMKECKMRKKPLVYPVAETGLWGEAVRQRRPMITNDYDDEPLKRGYPEGHIEIRRHMNIPVFDGNKIVAVAGVGNKEDLYDESDVRQLSLLMDGMWRIMQRKKTEQEREDLLRTLAAKNEELESVVYTASHDLRSPLVNIDGFSSELAYSCKELQETIANTKIDESVESHVTEIIDEDITTSLDYIRSSATKMDMLMRGLLRLSRLGREATEIKKLDMNELINNIVTGLQHQIKKRGVEVVIKQLPSCLGDKSQISQVFTNLIDNAIKYVDPKRKGRIEIGGNRENNECVYYVNDNGMGIDPDCYGKIFDIFHRLNPEGPVGGEGIGLTIVKRIVDRHGGRIWMNSAVGEGTTFYVALKSSEQVRQL